MLNGEFDFLDLLAIISFSIQMSNRQAIVSLEDVQNEVNRAVKDIHMHLQEQDEKINEILEVIK